ncbi:MAG: uroporphyrinogen-III C-methyltransferase [Cyanobacteria bacterium J06641_5]
MGLAQRGKVYLVGTGLGAEATLTRQAQTILACAEVAIYDALVHPEILALLPAECPQIYVGKRGGQPSTPQAEINRLLVAYARQGRQVVRLKNGDPFIFGRAREEIEALAAAQIPIEIVPGLSSALAAPLLAHIPLTDKHLSTHFAVCTAHDLERLPWPALVQLDTLVILMGTRELPEILARLQQQGKSSPTPIAIVRAAGTPTQQTWTGTLANILQRTTGISLSPAVIIIGDTVQYRDIWQSPIVTAPQLPLAGKTILITRAAQQADTFGQMLRAQGATVLETPALEILPPTSWHDLDIALNEIASFNWLILASANGVEFFFNRLQEKGRDARALAGLKIAVVGRKTAAVLQQYGLTPDFTPANFIADALVAEFPEPISGKRFLFPRVESGGRAALIQDLTAKGGKVVEVAAYRSDCPQALAPVARAALETKHLDAITFASSKTARNFGKLLAPLLPLSETPGEYLQGVCLASIGPQTSQACQEIFGHIDLEAQEYTLDGLTQALVAWAQSRKS